MNNKNDLRYCYHCGEKKSLKMLSKVDNSYKENLGTEDEPHMFDFYDFIYVLRCNECMNVSIYRAEFTSGEERYFQETGESEIELFGRLLYPNIEHENASYIPEKIYNSYLSSIKVKNIDRSFSLIGLRRTLEMICKEKGYNDGMLGKKLKKMADDGVIPLVIDSIADSLKTEGNKAAHGDDVDFDIKTVNNMIEFTRIIINYLYVLPKKISNVQNALKNQL
ncbi:DUF4145 domain-containing protein [Halobacillus sp. KGW1]|uniref:DUF4145 domain-containing protein n=1 Tax=Halobacillus sp. KGW1 TaxID=1793726 RepID=UPI0007863456|nr:DUF4145 domain-containing protein [Halobacillus sp. KGW1]